MVLSHVIEQEERERENIEAGIGCPRCGSFDVECVTALTGEVDAETGKDLFGCRECGHLDVFLSFYQIGD